MKYGALSKGRLSYSASRCRSGKPSCSIESRVVRLCAAPVATCRRHSAAAGETAFPNSAAARTAAMPARRAGPIGRDDIVPPVMLLEGKHGLVLGIANKRSIAWGSTQAASREAARRAVTYQGERLEENVRELAQGLKDPLILPCDVSKDEDLDALAGSVGREFGGLDFVVHAVAYALREELDGEF